MASQRPLGQSEPHNRATAADGYNPVRVSREVKSLSNLAARSFDNAGCAGRAGGASKRWYALVRRATSFARLALPQTCALCAGRAGNALVCPACTAALPRLPPACPVCALPVAAAAVCGACITHPPPFATTVAPFVYAFPVDRLLQQFKYAGRLAFAEWAAMALAAAAAEAFAGREDDAGPAVVAAVPLAPARQRERGFNQAREIGVRVAHLPRAAGCGRPRTRGVVRAAGRVALVGARAKRSRRLRLPARRPRSRRRTRRRRHDHRRDAGRSGIGVAARGRGARRCVGRRADIAAGGGVMAGGDSIDAAPFRVSRSSSSIRRFPAIRAT